MAAQPETKQVIEPSAGAPASGVRKEEDGGGDVCCVCKKSFRSPKSLFGHMRSHPERSWRGVKPPRSPPADDPSPSASSSDPDDASMEFDEVGFTRSLQPLPRWSRKAKRGGTGVTTSETARTTTACATPSSPSSKLQQSTADSTVFSLLVTLANYSVASSSSQKRKASDFRAQIGSSMEGEAIRTTKGQAFPNGTGGLIDKFRREVFPIEKKQYKCKDCDKLFSNPQALGGHRSSHRSRGVAATATAPCTATTNATESTDEDQWKAPKEALIPPWYLTRGELKSGHENSPGSRCMTGSSSSGGGAEGGSAKIFPFDLNELPAVEEEEEEGEISWN
ncbi:zinc finger protein ZAT9-like [Malania oleifera]|uniref:zinc finger protein ZAT9-like n=1 Tax=Malania oleifera TaxID=397392 RepID=UPI0025ADB56D|nr:zinc finger protein ZAT9-like [Malania oleifera]